MRMFNLFPDTPYVKVTVYKIKNYVYYGGNVITDM